MQENYSLTPWLASPDPLNLQSHQVDVWRIFLNLPPASVKLLESALSTDERERAARFRFPGGRQRYTAARGCLRDILARYLDCEPGQLQFCANDYGKPALQNRYLEFNLSHSGDFALVAVTRNIRVGADVERVRPDLEFEQMARRFFSANEVSEWMAVPTAQRQVAFFNGWTRKEAYIKGQGLGLSLPLESFDVSLSEPAVLRATRPDPDEAACWTLLSLEVDPGYAAAIAVRGQSLELRLWDWELPAKGATYLNGKRQSLL